MVATGFYLNEVNVGAFLAEKTKDLGERRTSVYFNPAFSFQLWMELYVWIGCSNCFISGDNLNIPGRNNERPEKEANPLAI